MDAGMMPQASGGYPMADIHMPGAAIAMPPTSMPSELDNLINNLPGMDSTMLMMNGQMDGATGGDIDQNVYISSLDSNLENLLKSGDQADSGELVRLLTASNGLLSDNVDFKSDHNAAGLSYDPMQQDPRNPQWQ